MNSFEIGRQLTAITMGIDALERSMPAQGSLLGGEGLVPIYLGDGLVDARRYDDRDRIRADLTELEAQVAGLTAGPRRVFLHGMIKSVRVAVKMLSGASPSFEEKVTDLVGAPAGREDAALIEDARAKVDALLRKSGFVRGSLAQRVQSWEEDRTVPTDRIDTVFRELMAEAKSRTDALIFDTGDYDMVLNPVRGMFYTARCSFKDGKMDLNLDLSFTRAALKHLVCHEVYPGHSTQLLSTKAAVEAGRAPADALLITTDAITGCVQEGIGDQGVHLIDFIEDADDEIHMELRRVRSASQTSAAWMLMVEGVAREEVADYLRNTAMGQEAWVQGRLRMAAHPFRGPFISSYWAGNESVRRVRERVTKDEWPIFLEALYSHANSPQSLEMFPQTVIEKA
ncbi:hypothetical protein [Rhizobium glycinendophyticum]|uniref:DUF885 domain-containing protein n=1 Tax=Rhizobium glycinendophyticum TaxID=2589807 RepID=A0A504ULD6_9HYPH|nr:hypothetical protein [Rhizobium glycinendophyticum]TPP05883.1 hypothetical protein FJQ55_19275 [Rhizobium glycinendophyticum]